MKNSVNDFASIGELLKDISLVSDIEMPTDRDVVPATEMNTKVHKTLPTTSLVTVVAYMIGFDLDKLLPLSEGGTHDRSNLIALCKSCHSQIHAKRGDRWHDR